MNSARLLDENTPVENISDETLLTVTAEIQSHLAQLHLSISRGGTVSWGVIKKAYRKRALETHPDKHSTEEKDEVTGYEEMFKIVSGAYLTLEQAIRGEQVSSDVIWDSSRLARLDKLREDVPAFREYIRVSDLESKRELEKIDREYMDYFSTLEADIVACIQKDDEKTEDVDLRVSKLKALRLAHIAWKKRMEEKIYGIKVNRIRLADLLEKKCWRIQESVPQYFSASFTPEDNNNVFSPVLAAAFSTSAVPINCKANVSTASSVELTPLSQASKSTMANSSIISDLSNGLSGIAEAILEFGNAMTNQSRAYYNLLGQFTAPEGELVRHENQNVPSVHLAAPIAASVITFPIAYFVCALAIPALPLGAIVIASIVLPIATIAVASLLVVPLSLNSYQSLHKGFIETTRYLDAFENPFSYPEKGVCGVNIDPEQDNRNIVRRYLYGSPGWLLGAMSGVIYAIPSGIQKFFVDNTHAFTYLFPRIMNPLLPGNTPDDMFQLSEGEALKKWHSHVLGLPGYLISIALGLVFGAMALIARTVVADTGCAFVYLFPRLVNWALPSADNLADSWGIPEGNVLDRWYNHFFGIPGYLLGGSIGLLFGAIALAGLTLRDMICQTGTQFARLSGALWNVALERKPFNGWGYYETDKQWGIIDYLSAGIGYTLALIASIPAAITLFLRKLPILMLTTVGLAFTVLTSPLTLITKMLYRHRFSENEKNDPCIQRFKNLYSALNSGGNFPEEGGVINDNQSGENRLWSVSIRRCLTWDVSIGTEKLLTRFLKEYREKIASAHAIEEKSGQPNERLLFKEEIDAIFNVDDIKEKEKTAQFAKNYVFSEEKKQEENISTIIPSDLCETPRQTWASFFVYNKSGQKEVKQLPFAVGCHSSP